MKRPLLPFALLALSLAASPAQSLKDIPPPTAPFVAAVPANAAWTVTVKYPPAPPAAPAAPDASPKVDHRVAEVRVAKTGKTRHDQIISVDGTATDRWTVDTIVLVKMPQGFVDAYDSSLMPAPDLRIPSPDAPVGYAGTGWLALDYYDQAVVFEKATCHHYAHGKLEAWVDVESRLPVAVKDGDAVYRFTFQAPPSQPLVLPAEFQEVCDRCQKAIEHQRQLQRDLGAH